MKLGSPFLSLVKSTDNETGIGSTLIALTTHFLKSYSGIIVTDPSSVPENNHDGRGRRERV
uniref:Uncharacterized protein n=1 Tax=Medicago truncatula TaxID=3880 RepID=A2Q1Y9_MEDTR|nr:hypothetical protein MtrDRAFT_AC149134g29v2 [Medicago truncatula]